MSRRSFPTVAFALCIHLPELPLRIFSHLPWCPGLPFGSLNVDSRSCMPTAGRGNTGPPESSMQMHGREQVLCHEALECSIVGELVPYRDSMFHLRKLSLSEAFPSIDRILSFLKKASPCWSSVLFLGSTCLLHASHGCLACAFYNVLSISLEPTPVC